MTLKLDRFVGSVTESPETLGVYIQSLVKQINDAQIARRRLVRVDNVTTATQVRLANPGFVVGGIVLVQVRRTDIVGPVLAVSIDWVQGPDGLIKIDLTGLAVGGKYNLTLEVIENG